MDNQYQNGMTEEEFEEITAVKEDGFMDFLRTCVATGIGAAIGTAVGVWLGFKGSEIVVRIAGETLQDAAPAITDTVAETIEDVVEEVI